MTKEPEQRFTIFRLRLRGIEKNEFPKTLFGLTIARYAINVIKKNQNLKRRFQVLCDFWFWLTFDDFECAH